MNVFNLTDSQYVSDTLKENVDYVVVKDGNGAETKIVNLNNPEICLRNGFIEIEAMKRSNKHENTKLVRRVRDKKTNLYIGVPSGINPDTKELMWKAFWIDDKMTFDLAIPDQAIAWHIIKNSQFVEGSPNQQGKSLWRVIDREVIAHKEIKTRSLKRKAEDIIESLKGEQLVDMAIMMGINIEANKSVFMMTNELYRKADLDPAKFLDLYNNPKREYISVFKKGLAKGIINLDNATGSYIYGNMPMGHNEEMAIQFLIDHVGISSSITMKCNQEDVDSAKAMAPIKAPVVDKEAEYLREIAELKAKLKADKPVEDFKSPFEDMTSDEKLKNEELEILRERAKKLKIQGASLPTMTREKLIEKIAAAEDKE